MYRAINNIREKKTENIAKGSLVALEGEGLEELMNMKNILVPFVPLMPWKLGIHVEVEEKNGSKKVK